MSFTSPWGQERLDIMDGERISLRLEQEDLELIDDFVEQHPEFSNRSHLARMAIRSFIEKDRNVIKPSATHVTINVPGRVKSMIESMVEQGYYTSFEAAVEDALRKEFLSKKLDEVKDRTFDSDRKILERM